MMSHDVNFIFMESTGDINLNELNPLYPIQKLYPLLYPIKYEPILSIIISHYVFISILFDPSMSQEELSSKLRQCSSAAGAAGAAGGWGAAFASARAQLVQMLCLLCYSRCDGKIAMKNPHGNRV